jgi:SAM-dependent methyltransferase
MSVIACYLPKSIKRAIKKVIHRGNAHFCPVCETPLRHFFPAGATPRANARCPICGSLERHRMIYLYFKNETNLFSNERKTMLHVAPEECFIERIGKINAINYVTADLTAPAKVQMDITDIQLDDNSFDVIYCSHVLEHIVDDCKAMRELHRVLKPNGWAVLQVPIKAEKTFEDPTIAAQDEREKYFGQKDHVRVYGLDYKERLEKAGFIVQIVPYLDSFPIKTLIKYGIINEREEVYLCRKQ